VSRLSVRKLRYVKERGQGTEEEEEEEVGA
jgi:hypothetical protein